jgi:FkbM family methyltransferase
LSQARRLSVAAGVVALLVLAFIPEGDQADQVAFSALVMLAFATSLGWLQILTTVRPQPPASNAVRHPSRQRWGVVAFGVALLAGLAVQTWFQPGSSIASGDIPPPDGTAWVGRLFEPWTWGGSDLGGPSQLSLQLPWATVLAVSHALGGDPAMAQRIWYTMLFVGAALGAFGLLAALRMSSVAAFVGTTVYVLSPLVVSQVTVNTVFLAALGLLAALPAAIVAAGTGRISMRLGAVLVAISAPLIGYVDLNPPLVGMLLGAMMTAPLVAAWVDGREAGFRSFRTLLLAMPLLIAASAYWLVPSILHLSTVVSDQLAPLVSWTWTEGRATIRNAFWLNTFWAWAFPEYFPYAKAYEVPPVSSLRFVLPAIAFSALAFRPESRSNSQTFHRNRELRLAVAVATVALALIFVSTGTNPPGNVLFDPLYNLPMGWLLREPGRFLMVVALAYAVLVALVIQGLVKGPVIARLLELRAKEADLLVLARMAGSHIEVRRQSVWLRSLRLAGEPTARLAVIPAAVGVAVALGFPVYTGSFVPDARPQLPPAHVRMPSYWPEMARLVDGMPVQGAVLVLPPDDFYAMPYAWGYYGTDDFVVNLFHRPVLIPNGEGYSPASNQVLSAVNLTARSILNRNWQRTEDLLTALNTPLILVRGDIQSKFPGRTILSPGDLASSLASAPNYFEFVDRVGALDLFRLRPSTSEVDRVPNFTTINTQKPDLRLIPLLRNPALVSSPPQAGMDHAIQAPPLNLWQDVGESLVWKPDAPLAQRYQMADLDSQSTVALDHEGTFSVGQSNARVIYGRGSTNNSITVFIRKGPINPPMSLVLVATPEQPIRTVELVVRHSTYSTLWQASDGSRHVLVDGMLNGWLIQAGTEQFRAWYGPRDVFIAAQWISLSALALLLGLLGGGPGRQWWRRLGMHGRGIGAGDRLRDRAAIAALVGLRALAPIWSQLDHIHIRPPSPLGLVGRYRIRDGANRWEVGANEGAAYLFPATELGTAYRELEITQGTCIDVGASFGWYSVGWAKRLGTHGKVLALEPDPRHYVSLVRNLKLNGLTNVIPVACAAGDYEGTLDLFTPAFGLTIFDASAVRQEGMTAPIKVPMRTIDSLCSEFELVDIRLVKIDVEGFEPQVLHGMARLLERDRPTVIFEAWTAEALSACRAELPNDYKIRQLNDWDHVAAPQEASVRGHLPT